LSSAGVPEIIQELLSKCRLKQVYNERKTLARSEVYMSYNGDKKNLSHEFLQHIYKLPQGKKIDRCIQCGTCSASCPTSGAMEYGPRETIAALRAGMLDRVLKSNTVWLCASCYYCAVRCPAKIPFTDIMYELKRLGVKHGIYPRKATHAVMARAFVEAVNRYGRNSEPELIRKYYLRTNPLKMMAQLKFAMKLFFDGRLELFPRKIKGINGLRKMMVMADNGGEQ
jgi:heterodisulfide reductase subunit C